MRQNNIKIEIYGYALLSLDYENKCNQNIYRHMNSMFIVLLNVNALLRVSCVGGRIILLIFIG